MVLVFLILMFALWSTVYRSTSSLLRIETNRVLQQTRDQGAMNALAQAIQLLQYCHASRLVQSKSRAVRLRRDGDDSGSERRLCNGRLHGAVHSGPAERDQLLASTGDARNLQRSTSDSRRHSPVAVSDAGSPGSGRCFARSRGRGINQARRHVRPNIA